MNDYEALGLSPAASKEEIKKAYFRLIRTHSPEKDPEGFTKIRQAYENLQAQDSAQKEPVFDIPDVPIIRKFAEQIMRCQAQGDYDFARETAEEAHRRFPDVLFFLYQTERTQRNSGKSGKAVKTARLLIEKEPKNPWFWRELAVAYWERGYIRKAGPAFQKACDLGCKDNDFLLCYADNCLRTNDYPTGLAVAGQVLQSTDRWKDSDLSDAVVAYGFSAAFSGILGIHTDPIAEKFCGFIRQYKNRLADYLPDCIEVCSALASVQISSSSFRNILETLSVLQDAVRDEDDIEILKTGEKNIKILRINHDKRICRSIQYWNELILGEMNDRYARTDCELCMIQERTQVLSAQTILKEEYSWLFESLRPFLQQLSRENEIPSLIRRKTQEYLRLMEYYEDEGNYFQWYPEMKASSHGRIISGSETPYVRTAKKIGRNDPCPCGSGKKYKHCCGKN